MTKLKRAAAVRLATEWTGEQGAVARPAAVAKDRKPICVEAFLAWAYRQELPKQAPDASPAEYPSPALTAANMAVLGTSIDNARLNRYGLMPVLGSAAEPHPDAVMAGNVVQALEHFIVDLPADWNPLSDMMRIDFEAAEIGPERVRGTPVQDAVNRAAERLLVMVNGRERLRSTPARLIIRHAMLGGCPDWEAEMPQVKLVSVNGNAKWFRMAKIASETVDGGIVWREEEVEGRNMRSRRPYPDAYRRIWLDPDPVDVAVSRSEYEIWHASLGFIVSQLGGRLKDHVLLPTERVARPWQP